MPDAKKSFRLTQKEKILAYAVIAVVVIFFFQKVILSGVFSKVHNISNQIKASEAELSLAMGIQSRKDTIEEDSKTYSAFLSTESVSDVKAVTDFLKEVEDIARRAGVSIVNLSPENQNKEAGEYKKIYASLRFESSPDQLFAFLDEVGKSKRLVKAEKLAISAKDEDATALRVDATMSMAAL